MNTILSGFLPLVTGRIAWTATYTYILLLFVAAAFVAYIARPRAHGEAVKRLYAGKLLPRTENDEDTVPRVRVKCLDGGKVSIERLGYDNLTSSGAVSLAVTTKGKDVEILERFTPGFPGDELMAGAIFEVDMGGFEWRHVKWVDEDSGLWCAFTLHVRQGIDFTVALKR